MKILFTGEQGQLARTIMARLGSEYVVKVDDAHKTRVSKHHPWLELNVTDPIALCNAFTDEKPDVVVHSAAVVNTDKCAADPARSVAVNLMGTQNVLDACRHFGAKMLYFSTTATYDPAPNMQRPFTEFSPQRAPTMYGITKYAGEMLVTGQRKVPYMVVRPCFIYGDPPFDHSSQLCRVAVHEALRQLWPQEAGPAPAVTLDPNALKDYMRVEDFAVAVCQILELDSWKGEVFNVSAMKPRPMGQYFDMLRRAMRISHLDMTWRPEADYMGDHTVDSSRLRACTGWRSEICMEDGIQMLALAAMKYVRDCKSGRNTLLYK